MRNWPILCSIILLSAACGANNPGTEADEETAPEAKEPAKGGETELVPVVGKDGKPVVDEDGEPVKVPADQVDDKGMLIEVVAENSAPILVNDCADNSCRQLANGNEPPPPGCGDGELTEDEACDDGNLESGDGCTSNCLLTEPGWSCALPGRACQKIARCGDGLKAESEQCDDANMLPGDGCSPRCRIELGFDCTEAGCAPTVCGDGEVKGAEACDDGNNAPFDGCSPICLREPNCEGLSCTSECGDGLVIEEACDDGNQIDGDGCSANCEIEDGFTCTRETACEMINGECILRVPAIFRDFPGSNPDFGETNCSTLLQGMVLPELDAAGRPVLSPNVQPAQACVESSDSFSKWYGDEGNETLVGEVVLFDNGRGGYVNRFGNDGTTFTSIDPTTETSRGTSLAGCEASCANEARNNHSAGCDNECRPLTEKVRQANELVARTTRDDLRQAQDQAEQLGLNPLDGGVATIVQDVLDEIAALEVAAAAATAAATECTTTCEAAVAQETSLCAATCGQCSYDPNNFCTGGALIEWEGNPLFFPVDGVAGPTANSEPAKIPSQYGYNGWPWEEVWFPNAPDHNFYFTSQVQYWFQYDPATDATLDFLGDDDVWVFINGHLAVDIGGIHVPVEGSVTISGGMLSSTVTTPAAGTIAMPVPGQTFTDNFTAQEFGLEEGNVYKITIFHAERQMEGSSFKLTLSGFEAKPSDCVAECGDGVLSFGEECDDGVNDGGYGECAPGCVLGPFCGDGIKQPPETCDNGPGGGVACPGCRELMITIQ